MRKLLVTLVSLALAGAAHALPKPPTKVEKTADIRSMEPTSPVRIDHLPSGTNSTGSPSSGSGGTIFIATSHRCPDGTHTSDKCEEMPTRWGPLEHNACPYCLAKGEKSALHLPSGSYATMLPVDVFYDEVGMIHAHDPNVVTRTLRCSRGHVFLHKQRFSCPMGDYDHGTTLTTTATVIAGTVKNNSLACTNPPCTTTLPAAPGKTPDREWLGGACSDDDKNWYLPTDGLPCPNWNAWGKGPTGAALERSRACYPPESVQEISAPGKICWVYPTVFIPTPTPSRP